MSGRYDQRSQVTPRRPDGGRATVRVGPHLGPIRLTPTRVFIGVALLGSVAYLVYALTVRDANQIPLLASGAAILGAAATTSTWVVVLSFFPFTSPYVMLVRVVDGTVEPWEPILAMVILVATIGVMLVVASRIYSAGVLLYGQRPTLRALVAAARVSR